MRGPVILNDRHKQTLLRGSAPQNPTAPGVRPRLDWLILSLCGLIYSHKPF